MPSKPWELYDAEGPSSDDLPKAVFTIFLLLIIASITVSTLFGA